MKDLNEVGSKKSEKKSATALISMTPAEKKKFVEAALEHGLCLSAFLRLAANEYINNHKW